ncbi:hypothetical protein QLQ12_37580 [Actinoplanes sp. NEAU-A12]|uniref:Uncharacterized protein n=1 Tax=Actinoplanes sandaracinus TaxID=3045177 RepID=A0ABT6WX58_9ACTN|nr:hypothetical protein [Actinoplanes sandaracinus]MDI6104320.1 hypothetical protein [Actinoplanes sandaracinus]
MSPAMDDPAVGYVATDEGVGVVRLGCDAGWTLTVEEQTGGPIRAAAYLPNGNRVTVGHDGGVHVTTPADGHGGA